MKTIVTETVQTRDDRPARRGHTFTFALVALLVFVTACTAAVVLTWHGATSDSRLLPTRIVGSDTFVGRVYDQQVPTATGPLTAVPEWQGPPYLPFNADPNDLRTPGRNSPRRTAIGNASNGIQALDDDSAALTVQQKTKR